MEVEEKQVLVRIITAKSGKELYKKSNPEIYGKKIALGINDSPENWAERDETIPEPPTLGTLD